MICEQEKVKPKPIWVNVAGREWVRMIRAFCYGKECKEQGDKMNMLLVTFPVEGSKRRRARFCSLFCLLEWVEMQMK